MHVSYCDFDKHPWGSAIESYHVDIYNCILKITSSNQYAGYINDGLVWTGGDVYSQLNQHNVKLKLVLYMTDQR